MPSRISLGLISNLGLISFGLPFENLIGFFYVITCTFSRITFGIPQGIPPHEFFLEFLQVISYDST